MWADPCNIFEFPLVASGCGGFLNLPQGAVRLHYAWSYHLLSGPVYFYYRETNDTEATIQMKSSSIQINEFLIL